MNVWDLENKFSTHKIQYISTYTPISLLVVCVCARDCVCVYVCMHMHDVYSK